MVDMYDVKFKLENLLNKTPDSVKDFTSGLLWSLAWDLIYQEPEPMTLGNTLPDTAMLSAFSLMYGVIEKRPLAETVKKTGAFALGTFAGQGIYHGIKYLI